MTKRIADKRTIPFLLLVLTILGSCIPAPTGEPAAPSSTPSGTALTATVPATASPTASETSQPAGTETPTASQTMPPTQTLMPLVLPTTAKPRKTKKKSPPAATETPQPTETVTATLTPTLPTISVTCFPPTPELLWVEPVISPTDQFTQVITVYIGHGVEVTVITESGTFTATGNFGAYANPAQVEITLLPNTEHHLQVIARVGLVPSNGCIFGDYTLSTTTDKQGAPLTILQGVPTP